MKLTMSFTASRESVRVVFPWSMCAAIVMFRVFCGISWSFCMYCCIASVGITYKHYVLLRESVEVSGLSHGRVTKHISIAGMQIV